MIYMGPTINDQLATWMADGFPYSTIYNQS
jgi:hypothetical protein